MVTASMVVRLGRGGGGSGSRKSGRLGVWRRLHVAATTLRVVVSGTHPGVYLYSATRCGIDFYAWDRVGYRRSGK